MICDDDNPSLSARSTKYSFLGSGRTFDERKRLRRLTSFITDSLLEFQDLWQNMTHPQNVRNQNALAAWMPYVESNAWDTVPGLWVESWANVNRRTSEQEGSSWGQGKTHIAPHLHSFPYSGYITLDAEPSVTVFRSPFTRKLFTVDGQNGRLHLFPGGIRHSTLPWDGATPRISLAFNIDFTQPGTHVSCQIPLTMKYCKSQVHHTTEIAKQSW